MSGWTTLGPTSDSRVSAVRLTDLFQPGESSREAESPSPNEEGSKELLTGLGELVGLANVQMKPCSMGSKAGRAVYKGINVSLG